MNAFVFVALFVLLILLGVPIAFVIGLVSLLGIVSIPFIPNLTVFMKMFNGLPRMKSMLRLRSCASSTMRKVQIFATVHDRRAG